ncbi:4243_t:CDS:1 [Paraglomus occultum]|uniref:4243_t:CDS:1 n=1 Tax=Paraglomus occultum TaxID=144539 RepID=A0A9N8WL07_9GLOM|nr:4243_t:CDS:1 [Paraglomus occultum]
MDGTKLKQVRRLKNLLLRQILCRRTTYEEYHILRALYNSLNDNLSSHPILVEDKFEEVFGYLRIIHENKDIWCKLAQLSELSQSIPEGSSQTNVSIDFNSQPRTSDSPQTSQPPRRGKARKKITHTPYSKPAKQISDSNAPFCTYGRKLPADFNQYYQTFSLKESEDHRNTALQMSSGTHTLTSITETEELSIPDTMSTINNSCASTVITRFSPGSMSTHTPDRGSTANSDCTIAGLSVNGSTITLSGYPISESPRSMSTDRGSTINSDCTIAGLSVNGNTITLGGYPISESPRSMSTHTSDRGSTSSGDSTVAPINSISSTMITYCKSPRSMSYSIVEPTASNTLSSDVLTYNNV